MTIWMGPTKDHLDGPTKDHPNGHLLFFFKNAHAVIAEPICVVVLPVIVAVIIAVVLSVI